MFIPKWAVAVFALLLVALFSWTVMLARDRNPLPFPDRGSRIFTAASPEGKDAVVELLSMHGLEQRFRANTESVQRSVMWDGTIINYAHPDVLEKLGNPAASIGLVADDPAATAAAAAEFLRNRGFEARVVLDAEPELPIAFVITDALQGTVLNFRKHMIRMPRPE